MSKGRHTATLFGKPECHLCDDARATLERLKAEYDLVVAEVDITGDGTLFERYKELIPVVVIDDKVVLESYITERGLRKALNANSPKAGIA